MPEPPSRTPDRDNNVDASRSFKRAFFGSVIEARDASPNRLKRNRMTQPIHLIQFRNSGNRACCALLDGNTARPNAEGDSTYDLATRAINSRRSLMDMISEVDWASPHPVSSLTLLPPATHPDPAHLHGPGTGLTHLGSANARSAMHAAGNQETDSMRMFRWGIEGGRPEGDVPGAEPEWFYKGNGHTLISPGAPIESPSFAMDAGEEPELAGVYLIGPCGTPFRLGFAISNEFSDHVLERRNYLLLAHSKLREYSIGPALRVGPAPDDIRGVSRILRKDAVIWSKPFLTGEANMSHSLANLEHHHFKYALFRQPGDVHVHMFGTATLSFADGIQCENGDVYEIEAEGFGPALRNPLCIDLKVGQRRVSVSTL